MYLCASAHALLFAKTRVSSSEDSALLTPCAACRISSDAGLEVAISPTVWASAIFRSQKVHVFAAIPVLGYLIGVPTYDFLQNPFLSNFATGGQTRMKDCGVFSFEIVSPPSMVNGSSCVFSLSATQSVNRGFGLFLLVMSGPSFFYAGCFLLLSLLQSVMEFWEATRSLVSFCYHLFSSCRCACLVPTKFACQPLLLPLDFGATQQCGVLPKEGILCCSIHFGALLWTSNFLCLTPPRVHGMEMRLLLISS